MSKNADTENGEEWYHAQDDIPEAPLRPEEWVPGEHVIVECSACSHEWLFSGHTPYAQCKCGKSNTVLGYE
mgnify:FL=1